MTHWSSLLPCDSLDMRRMGGEVVEFNLFSPRYKIEKNSQLHALAAV
jgi:hypothetical protein